METLLTPKQEIRALTGLRGIAALDVAFGHARASALPFLAMFDVGNMAVDVFSVSVVLPYVLSISQRINNPCRGGAI